MQRVKVTQIHVKEQRPGMEEFLLGGSNGQVIRLRMSGAVGLVDKIVNKFPAAAVSRVQQVSVAQPQPL